MSQLFVGNLPYTTTESDLEDLFASYGTVKSVKIIADRYTGKSRGFGFVELESGAEKAIEELNDSDQLGRKIVVKEANEKERTGPGSGPRGGSDRPDRSSSSDRPRAPREGQGRERRQRDY